MLSSEADMVVGVLVRCRDAPSPPRMAKRAAGEFQQCRYQVVHVKTIFAARKDPLPGTGPIMLHS